MQRKSIRSLGIALVIAMVLAPDLALARASREANTGVTDPLAMPARVVIGYQAIPNGEIVAKNLGWVEETLGVPVRWVQFNSGSELNAAMAAGSVDIGLGGSSTTVAAIAQGVPVEVIWIQDIIGDNEALVVRQDAPIYEVNDLVGRRVAAPFGATTHYHLMVALELAGVDPATLTIMDMTPQDMRAAWQRGDIDAGFVWEPTLAAMLEMNGRVLVSSGELAAQGFLTGDITVARRDFGQRYPEAVRRYLQTQVRAVELIRQDPDAAAAAVAREFGIAASEALRQMRTLVFLSGPEQLGSRYLGQPGAVGELAAVFAATGEFLAAQRTIRLAPERAVFAAAINPRYLEAALR